MGIERHDGGGNPAGSSWAHAPGLPLETNGAHHADHLRLRNDSMEVGLIHWGAARGTVPWVGFPLDTRNITSFILLLPYVPMVDVRGL